MHIILRDLSSGHYHSTNVQTLRQFSSEPDSEEIVDRTVLSINLPIKCTINVIPREAVSVKLFISVFVIAVSNLAPPRLILLSFLPSLYVNDGSVSYVVASWTFS